MDPVTISVVVLPLILAAVTELVTKSLFGGVTIDAKCVEHKISSLELGKVLLLDTSRKEGAGGATCAYVGPIVRTCAQGTYAQKVFAESTANTVIWRHFSNYFYLRKEQYLRMYCHAFPFADVATVDSWSSSPNGAAHWAAQVDANNGYARTSEVPDPVQAPAGGTNDAGAYVACLQVPAPQSPEEIAWQKFLAVQPVDFDWDKLPIPEFGTITATGAKLLVLPGLLNLLTDADIPGPALANRDEGWMLNQVQFRMDTKAITDLGWRSMVHKVYVNSAQYKADTDAANKRYTDEQEQARKDREAADALQRAKTSSAAGGGMSFGQKLGLGVAGGLAVALGLKLVFGKKAA